MQAFVRDNDVEQALRIFKRKMQREGVFREMLGRPSYEKPSDKAAGHRTDCSRWRRCFGKQLRSRASRLPLFDLAPRGRSLGLI